MKVDAKAEIQKMVKDAMGAHQKLYYGKILDPVLLKNFQNAFSTYINAAGKGDLRAMAQTYNPVLNAAKLLEAYTPPPRGLTKDPTQLRQFLSSALMQLKREGINDGYLKLIDDKLINYKGVGANTYKGFINTLIAKYPSVVALARRWKLLTPNSPSLASLAPVTKKFESSVVPAAANVAERISNVTNLPMGDRVIVPPEPKGNVLPLVLGATALLFMR